MTTKNRPAWANTQFVRPAVLGVARVAASCQLYAWVAGGTVTPQTTWQDQAGTAPNANPIILDSEGACSLFLDPALDYMLELRAPVAEGGAVLRQWDHVKGAATATGVVTSVNGLSGAVALDASGIPYATSAAVGWFSATDAEAAFDQILNHENTQDAAITAAAEAAGAAAAAASSASPGRLLRVTYYKTTGVTNWAKGVDVGSIEVELVAGGASSSASGLVGGGAGGYSRKRILAAALAANEVVTVGAGGAAGGNAGGASSFGAHCSATGGALGATNTGGAGGSGTGGDLNIDGGGGGGSHGGVDFQLGHGGNSFFGGGARGSGGVGVVAGFAGAANTGGGGGGGSNAAGGSGVVIVREFS